MIRLTVAILLLTLTAPAYAVRERVCFDDETPNRLWLGGWVEGEPMVAPFGLGDETIDKCFRVELPALAALSRALEAYPALRQRRPNACFYDVDQSGAVELSDVARLIGRAMLELGKACP